MFICNASNKVFKELINIFCFIVHKQNYIPFENHRLKFFETWRVLISFSLVMLLTLSKRYIAKTKSKHLLIETKANTSSQAAILKGYTFTLYYK